ncbi:MAG: O-antigen ligase family protein [Acidobacteriota bacterium]
MLLFAILISGILTMWVPSRWALSGFQLAIFALLAGRILADWRQHRNLRNEPTGVLLALVIGWGGTQLLLGWSVDPFRTLEEILNWTTNLAAFALAFELASHPARRQRFLTGLLIFASVLAVVAMLTAFSSPPGFIAWWIDVGTGLPTLGPFVYRNQYAAFVEVILPIALLRALLSARPALYLVAIALLFASVIAGGSRTGAILCATEIVLVPLLAWTRGLAPGRAIVRVTLGSLLAVASFTLVAGWEFIWARFQEPNPYGLRWDLLRSSIEMVKARPWTGFGLGTWAQAYPGFALFDDGNYVNQAHNDWAQWTVEGGIPMLAILLAVAARAVRPALRSIWGVGLLAVLLHSCVDYPLQQRPVLAAFFFVMLGLAMNPPAPDHLSPNPS